MEEYLQYMRTLRSQMNDVEDQAAKISVEEQMLITTIQTTENDLSSVKSETRQLHDKIDEMVKTKGQICSQILDRQRKIASLESDSSNLVQTLELIRQERVSLSAKLLEKRTYYTKVAEDMNAKLQEQQDWFNSRKLCRDAKGHKVNFLPELQVKYKLDGQTAQTGEFQSHEVKNSTINLDFAKAKLCHLTQMKLKLVMENGEMKESTEQLKRQIDNFKSELKALDIKTLEEEHGALLSDKTGEMEYLRSLQQQMTKLKGISHRIKCACGEEYEVQMGLHA